MDEITFRKPGPLDPVALAEIAGMFANGSDIHVIIRRMRAFGFGKIDCIKTLRDQAGIPIGRGKDIVHLSPAWADRYESDEALHDMAERVLWMSDEEERTAA